MERDHDTDYAIEEVIVPHEAATLFAARDQLRGTDSLLAIIEVEFSAIQRAGPQLLAARYLSAETYYAALQSQSAPSPYNHPDASYVNVRIRDEVYARARELGMDIGDRAAA